MAVFSHIIFCVPKRNNERTLEWSEHFTQASPSFFYYYYSKFYLFIYLFLAVLGLRFCARAFSSCGKRGPLFIAVRRPLTIAASLVGEHRLQSRRLSSWLHLVLRTARGILVPRPGIEPEFPAVETQSLNHWTTREVLALTTFYPPK